MSKKTEEMARVRLMRGMMDKAKGMLPGIKAT
jgi:hypothetical protein